MVRHTGTAAAGSIGVLAVLVASVGVILARQATSTQPSTGAVPAPPSWVPAELAARLHQEPKSKDDLAVRAAIAEYEGQLARLRQDDPLVAKYLPHLRDLVVMLYREYNLDKARYTSDLFPVADCLEVLKAEMAFFLGTGTGQGQRPGLEHGKDPLASPVPTWLARVCWVEATNIMGQYHLSVPKDYDAKKPWPIAISYQNGPEKEQRRAQPYFFITGVQKDYPKGMTTVENKTRTFLKDAAREFNIDPFRVYATGFSYGGHTDLTIAWRFPHWFAAITPLCSDLRGPDAPNVKYLKNVPALLLHGDSDSFLATGKIVYEYMKEAGCAVTFQTYRGGHDAAPIFRSNVQLLVDFWGKHVMDPYPKTVSHIVEHPRYSRAFWVDARLVKPGDAAGTFEVRVKDGNRIEVDANEQTAELDLYLTGKLVDMGKLVTVVSGGRTVYEGKAQAKVTVRLREGNDYKRGPGDTLWQDLLDARGR